MATTASPAQIGWGIVSVILGITTIAVTADGIMKGNQNEILAGIPFSILTGGSAYLSVKAPYQ